MKIHKSPMKEPPTFFPCPYCQQQIEGSHTRETSVQYMCRNHHPLIIDWYCNRKINREWVFNNLVIALPNQFRLYYTIDSEDYNFYLHECRKSWNDSEKFIWSYFKDLNGLPKTFPSDWIFAQSTDKLLSIFQMYKIFS